MRSITRNKKKQATVICFGDCSGSELPNREAKIMKFNVNIYINREKRNAMQRLYAENNIMSSPIIAYAIDCLIDMKRGYYVSPLDRKFIQMGLSEYRPFFKDSDVCPTGVSICSSYNRTEMVNILSLYGIKLVPLCRAFYDALLKCDITSIPSFSTKDGFLIGEVKSYRVKRLANTEFKIALRLSNQSHLKLKAISEENGTNPTALISSVLNTVLEMEFNDVSVINRENLTNEILQYPGRTDINGGMRYCYHIYNIEKSVKLLILLERYGIPGKSELIKRVIRFIIMAYEGQISLTKICVCDDSDYNETRMIRNEFRKEVLYAATR